MKASVRNIFSSFTEKYEGHTDFLYCDVKGLVTTGRGNLADPIIEALNMPWTIHNVIATQADIVDGWNAVKARQDLKYQGGFAYRNVSQLRLSDDAVDNLTLSKLDEMEGHLSVRFADWSSLPADAQLGTLSMAWACGPFFRFPIFENALRAMDFSICAAACHMDEAGNPGLKPRNLANKALFLAAEISTDPETLSPPWGSPPII